MHSKVLITLISSVILTHFIDSSQAEINPIRITSILDEPYMMLKPSDHPLIGNERYEGFVPDLAEIFSKKLNFTYDLSIVKDGMYGAKSKEGVWDGMIGELNRSTADIAISPLTMTAERANVVDFSSPFMEFQFRIAMKKDEGQMAEGPSDPGSFIFLRPFSGVLWAATFASILILVLLLYTIELYVPRRQTSNGVLPEKVKFCLNGICGSPRTVSGRILQVLVWVFMVAVVAAYIAAFTGDLIVDRLGKPGESGLAIKSIEDLGSQTEVKYGVIRGGSTYTYFKRSWERLHRKMFSMLARESVSNATEGFQKVRNVSSYAFIGEGPYAEYMESKAPCDIILAPESFGPQRFFAVATRNSVSDPNLKRLRDGINLIILRMRENLDMENLGRKWFVDPTDCLSTRRSVDDQVGREMDNALCLYDMAGIFYLLLAAILLAIGIAGLEVYGKRPIQPRRTGAVELRVPLHPARDVRQGPPANSR